MRLIAQPLALCALGLSCGLVSVACGSGTATEEDGLGLGGSAGTDDAGTAPDSGGDGDVDGEPDGADENEGGEAQPCDEPNHDRCGAECVDLQSDPRHCGACDVDCAQLANVTPSAVSCVGGNCSLDGACAAGFADCDDNATNGCEADLSKAEHCGACDVTCSPPTPACSEEGLSGTFKCVDDCPSDHPTLCGTECADTGSDVSHCGGCDTKCSAVANAKPTCQNGICGYACEPGYADDGVGCTDIDECAGGVAVCDPHATCANEPGSFSCTCAQGWTGDGHTCDDVDECALDLDGCAPQATCTNTPGGVACTCNPGWSGDGFTCVDIDECALNPGACDVHAVCTNTDGSYGCACLSGWTGDGVTCLDVDECALDLDNCDAHATCTNTPGSFTCTCDSGWTGNGLACTDIDECALNTDNCDAHATCTNTPGSFTCTCNTGWTGNGVTCTDIDECALNTDNCNAHATCTNTAGAFTCACNPGWTGNGVTCTDINECTLNTDNCDAHATCTNTPGSFTCTCNAGWTGNGVTCADIDECALNLDNCQPLETCTNLPGSYSCACPAPYVVCSGVCVDTSSDPANCGGCGIVCGSNQACAAGTCVGSGNLRVTLTWSRAGDLDLHVLTPTGAHIYYGNKGPYAGTDWGQLDVDDTTGSGPENVFWDTGYTPPTGTYHICVVPYNFTPDASANDPVNFTVKIARPGHPDQVLQGSRTSEWQTSLCSTSSPYYLTSFTYP